MILKSYAKINLSLASSGLRNDNYHEVLGITLPISLYDHVEISESIKDSCEVSCDLNLENFQQNLAFRALDLFRKKTGIKQNFDIRIVKNIPHMAGFGGGSSNAVTVLKFLNTYFGDILTIQDLESLCLQLGADCHFSLYNKPAKISGIGEKIEVLGKQFCENIQQYKFIIFKPKFSQNTTEAYKLLKEKFQFLYLSYEDSNIKISKLIKAVEAKENRLPMFNIFDELLCCTNSQYKFMKTKLQSFGVIQMLSGSGSGCFCISTNEEECNHIEKLLKQIFGDSVFIKGVNIQVL